MQQVIYVLRHRLPRVNTWLLNNSHFHSFSRDIPKPPLCTGFRLFYVSRTLENMPSATEGNLEFSPLYFESGDAEAHWS